MCCAIDQFQGQELLESHMVTKSLGCDGDRRGAEQMR